LGANLKDSAQEKADKKYSLKILFVIVKGNKFYFMEFIIIFDPFGTS